MHRPLSRKANITAYGGLSLLMLSALLFTSGCGAPSGPPGAGPASGPPGMGPGANPSGPKPPALTQAPPAIKTNTVTVPPAQAVAGTPGATPPGALPNMSGKPPLPVPNPDSKPPLPGTNPLGSVGKVEQAGNTVDLATDILAAGTNPFMNKLPKPEVPVAVEDPGTGATTVAEPPPDPFENVSLLGVVYNKKTPIVLLSVGTGAENSSRLARKGDVIDMEGGQVKVLAIKPDSVDLEIVGSKEKQTKSLPSIIGYTANATGGGAPAEETSTATSGSSVPKPGEINKPSKGHPRSSGGDPSDLANLKKLSGKKSPDVKLQEP